MRIIAAVLAILGIALIAWTISAVDSIHGDILPPEILVFPLAGLILIVGAITAYRCRK